MKRFCNGNLLKQAKQKLLIYFTFSLISFSLILPVSSSSQENTLVEEKLQEKAVKVFLDVSRWYKEFIKTEIPYVNYVRDRMQAQLYIMMTQQRTGAGGYEYTITLIGQNNFNTINDTVKYVSRQAETEDVRRRGIVRVLKLGLIRYVEKTPLADFIDIRYRREAKPTDVIDKWNYWVFNIDVETDLSGEEARDRYSLDLSFSADRVTPESKISLRASNNHSRRKDLLDEGWYTSNSIRRDLRGLYVKSLNDHWSAGMYAEANSSTYSNRDLSLNMAPAIELNVFPYSEYTRREFRFLYRVYYNNVQYIEETIYGKMRENLFYESLSATFELKERWGSLNSTLEGLHYFHDFKKNNLRLSGNLNLQLFEGFSINLFGHVSTIRDQLALPKEDATEEEILIRRREIATNYDYFISFGFRYTFGSIYSNVVNPRFGSGRRGYRR